MKGRRLEDNCHERGIFGRVMNANEFLFKDCNFWNMGSSSWLEWSWIEAMASSNGGT